MTKLIHFSELSPLAIQNKWFQVYQLPYNVFAIFEPYHFQEVISFLICGNEKALLLDTGMGIGNIKSVIEQLVSLPLIVVNSHSHFDHTGDNWRFEAVHLLNLPESVFLLEKGYKLPAGDENLSLNAYRYPEDLWFDYTKLQVKPSKIIPVSAGHIFHLGNRSLRVIATPGHSDDSIMLADDENKILFTGDTVYPAPLYAHLSQSNLETYMNTIKRIAAEFSDYTLMCSHNNPIWEGKALFEVENAFLYVYEQKKANPEIKQYQFSDFSIIA